MKIAITGTIGGGKSSVSRRLIDLGYDVYDTDKMVHAYYEKDGRMESTVIDMFGDAVLGNDGTIDRSKLANIVFNDIDRLFELESKVYPIVADHIESLYISSKGMMFFEVPMLFESKLEDNFDAIIMVTAPFDLRMKRLQDRGMTLDDVKRRSMRHMDEKEKIEKSDIIINNDSDLDSLNAKIDSVIKQLERR